MTVVNVKGVELSVWERAAEIAAAERITRGEIVNRALRQHLWAYDNPAEEPPPVVASPVPAIVAGSPVASEVWNALDRAAAILAATASAGNVKAPDTTQRRVYDLVDDGLRVMQGLPPKRPRNRDIETARQALPSSAGSET